MAANKKILNILAVCSFVFCASVTVSYAATINAASASYSDVSAAVSAASSGDTVTIPTDTKTWDSSLVVTKAVAIIGAGVGSTVITSNITSTPTYGFIRYNPQTPSTDNRFRVSGITFNCNNVSNGITIYNDSATAEYIRIDHNRFLDPGGTAARRGIAINGTVFGVIDNNTFDNLDYGASYDITASFYGTGAKLGRTQWDALNATLAFGGNDNLFFEDNTITSSHGNTIMHGQGGRSVIRYNTFGPATDNLLALIDIHGNQSPTITTNYATMIVEIYGNTVDFNTYGGYSTDHRGGRALVFFNTLSNVSGLIYSGKIREEFNDATIPEANAYIQRVYNSYYWTNKDDGAIISTFLSHQCSDGCGYEITENVNWWTERTGVFDGSGDSDKGGGCGCGTLASRPATCTIGVGYWATDQSCSNLTDYVGVNPATTISGTLYKCTATNTWTEYYTPYTYPHPLREETKASPPETPQNLKIVK